MSAFDDNPFAEEEEDEEFTPFREFSPRVPAPSASLAMKRPREEEVADPLATEAPWEEALPGPGCEAAQGPDPPAAAAEAQTTAALMDEFSAAREEAERSALAARAAALEEDLRRQESARAAELARAAKDNEELRASASLLRETIRRVWQEMDEAPQQQPPPNLIGDAVPVPWRPSDAQLREASALRERIRSRRAATAAAAAAAPRTVPSAPCDARAALLRVDAAAVALSQVRDAGPLPHALLAEWRRRAAQCARAQCAGSRAARRAANSAALLAEWQRCAESNAATGLRDEGALKESDAHATERCAQRAERMVGALLAESSTALRSAAAVRDAAPRLSALSIAARADRLGRAVLRLRRGGRDSPTLSPPGSVSGTDALAQMAAEFSARVAAAERIAASCTAQRERRGAGSPGAAVSAALLDATAAVQDAVIRELRALNAALQERSLGAHSNAPPAAVSAEGIRAAADAAVAAFAAAAAESREAAAAAAADAVRMAEGFGDIFAAGAPLVAVPAARAEAAGEEQPLALGGDTPELIAGEDNEEKEDKEDEELEQIERELQEETAALRRSAEGVDACLRWLETRPTHCAVPQLLAAHKEVEALRERLEAINRLEEEYQKECAELNEARAELEEAEAEMEAMRARMSEVDGVIRVTNTPSGAEGED